MNLQDLVALIVENWPFDETSYPGTQGLSETERQCFALRHILMHQAKAVGKLSEVVEPHDHGAPLDEEKLRLAIRNFFINTLRLAETAGVSVDELTHSVMGWASEKHQP